MAISIMPPPKVQFFDSNGNPLSGGKIYTYDAGTSTPKATYTDSTGATANANPVILDSRGEASIWLSGFYKIIVKDSDDTAIYTVDNISSMPASTITLTEWLAQSHVFTYIGATQFSVPGDETTTYQSNRRVKCTVSAGTVYGVITTSSYGSSITTVTVTLDSGNLDSGLSAVSVGLLAPTNPSLHEGFMSPKSGTARKHAANIGQLQDGGIIYAAATGTDTYTATLAPAITAYIDGAIYYIYFANANTITGVSLNINSLGVKTIFRSDGNALKVGDIGVGMNAILQYNPASGGLHLLNPHYPEIHTHGDTTNGGYVKGGSIQIQHTSSTAAVQSLTAMVYDDTIPQNTEGAELLTVSITPKNANHTLVIEGIINAGSNTTVGLAIALFKDSEANSRGAWPMPIDTVNTMVSIPFRYVMAAGAASAMTFKIRGGASGGADFTMNGWGNARKFGGASMSTLKVTEYQQD